MIRINLLAKGRPKRAERGQQTFLAGMLMVLLAGAAVWFFVDRPARARIHELQTENARLSGANAEIDKQLKTGWPLAGIPPEQTIKTTVDNLGKRREAIDALEAAAVTPAWMLRDLERVLSLRNNEQPTMTQATVAMLKDRPQLAFKGDEFDPRHVWITGFTEKDGVFKLAGGSQTESDINKLARRLDASVYFDQVSSEKYRQEIDKGTGITYFTFTITGKALY
jgi:Tfp pilus assembly protein PilN